MEKKSCGKQPLEKSSSFSLSDTTKDTVWKSSELLQNVVVVQNQSALERSTPHCTVSNEKISLSQDTVMKQLTSEEEQEGAITVSQAMDCLVFKRSSNTKAIFSPGNPPNLDFSRSCWTIKNLAPIVAYCLPSEKAEDWLGDLIEVCDGLMQSGTPRWQLNAIALIRILHLVWAAYKVTWSDFIGTDWDDCR
jgi:hypothetical protein